MLENFDCYKNDIKAIRMAQNIMFECHKNQVDKAENPYVFHPLRVAQYTYDILKSVGEPEYSTLYSTCYIVALLHDIIEDANYYVKDIEAKFGYDVACAVYFLTRSKHEKYSYYITNIHKKANSTDIKDMPRLWHIALIVKLADLKDNSDRSRLNTITEKDERRFAKYDLAERVLLYGLESDIEELKKFD